MAQCSTCGEPTSLYLNGTPICLSCARGHESKTSQAGATQSTPPMPKPQ
jgi:hypothetical protein